MNLIHCERCDVRCKVAGPGNPKAKMLRRSKDTGLCINCAVHDWLRNTYPVNMLLASSGPQALALPHIQEQFTGIMRVGLADAMPDEINWNLIIENWDLPFPQKLKTSAANPCSQQQLFDIASGKHEGFRSTPLPPDPLAGKTTITSFAELDQLEPGLGDDLKKCLGSE